MHTLFPNKVFLDKEAHRYYDNTGLEYMSFSKLYGFLTEKFDVENVSFHYANKHGMTQEDVKAKWKKQTDEGTRLDAALKRFSQTGQILIEDADLKDTIIMVSEKYSKYYSSYGDLVIYNEKYRTAGEIDRLCLVSNRKACNFIISDFKRFESDSTGLQDIKGNKKWLEWPFDYLPATKHTKITFQASYYAYHFELLTGRRCERLFIDTIIPVKDKGGKTIDVRNEVVPLIYMKHDVERLLDHCKDMILSELEGNKIEPAF